MQQKDNTSREFEMQPDTQQPDNTSQQFLVQSTMEVPKNTSQQSQTQPETTYIAELEAKNASLQAENDLLKSSKLVNPNVYEMMCENQLLKIDLEKAKECIQILLEQVEEKDQENAMLRTEGEKEIDRKGKKVAEKVKSVICFTRKDTNEVLTAMPISDSSDDSDGGGEETEDEDEDDVGQLRALMKMKMFNGKVGSSSKTGSGLETDCVLSNGEVEKTIINGENNQWVSKPLWSESDLIPNFLKSDEIASQGKTLYGHNYKEVSKLAGFSETGSSSCQMGLPPDDMKSKSHLSTKVGALKSNNAVALRNCIVSRCDMARITINTVLPQHLDLDKIPMSQRSSKTQEEEEDENDDVEDEKRGGGGEGGDERDEEVEENEEMEEEEKDDQIVRNKKNGIIIDDTSMKTKCKVPMVDDTSEKYKKSKGKVSIILSDHRADKVLEKKPIKLVFKSGAIANVGYWYKMLFESTSGKESKSNPSGSLGLVETTSHAEEASKVPGLVEVGGSVKTGLGQNRTIMKSPEEIDVDD